MRRKRILLTGSNGRLGHALAAFLSESHHVAQLDLAPPGDPAQRAIGDVFTGSITDPAAVRPAMEGCDAVIHCAAIPWNIPPLEQVVETNVVGAFVVLEAAGQTSTVEQFIYVSSICWHGLNDPPREEHLPTRLPFDETHLTSATSPYARSKVQCEEWCQAYAARFKKPVVALRPSYIVRLDEEPGFAARQDSRSPHLNEYVGTSDLLDLFERALDYAPPGGFDVFLANASDQLSRVPSLELAERFFAGIAVDREKLAQCDGFGAFVDCSRARERLGWAPKFRCVR